MVFLFVSEFYQWFFEGDETKKKTLKDTFAKETLPDFIKRMEGILDKNGGKYIAGEVRSLKSKYRAVVHDIAAVRKS